MEKVSKRVSGYCCPAHGFYQQARAEAYKCFLCEGPGMPVYEHARDYKCSRCGATSTGFFAPECCGTTAAPYMPKADVPYLIGAKAFEAFVSPATSRTEAKAGAARQTRSLASKRWLR